MTIPAGDAVLSSEWLSRTLEASPDWPGGARRVVSATRIGVDYGFSGRVHRVVAETQGQTVSFIVKQDGSAQIERELLFRSQLGERLPECIAKCFGGTSDRMIASCPRRLAAIAMRKPARASTERRWRFKPI